MIDLPTTRARALIEDVVSGRAFFGSEGYLPAYYESLATLWDYVGTDALVVLDTSNLQRIGRLAKHLDRHVLDPDT